MLPPFFIVAYRISTLQDGGGNEFGYMGTMRGRRDPARRDGLLSENGIDERDVLFCPSRVVYRTTEPGDEHRPMSEELANTPIWAAWPFQD